MMRVALFTVLLLVAASARAEWVRVTELGDTGYYVDPASVVDKDGVRQAWVLHDHAKPAPGGVRSRRVSYEIQCSAARLRSVAGSEYSEPMAQGSQVISWEQASDWHYVGPRTGTNIPARTPYLSIVRFVCSR